MAIETIDADARPGARTGRGNRLRSAPVFPITVPLWLGAERPGVDLGASALDAALRDRWAAREHPDLLARLAPTAEVPVDVPADAAARLGRKSLAFLPEIASACAAMADEVGAAVVEGGLALALGGDHAVSAGSLAGAARAARGDAEGPDAGRLGVLWFDTHPDLNTPATSPSGHVHGMALAAALGLGGPTLADLAPEGAAALPTDVCLLGVRDIDPGERALIRAHGIWALTMEEWTDGGVLAGLDAALGYLAAQGVEAVHVSWDLDVLDPSVLPGTGTCCPGGLTYREASQVLRRLHAWGGPIRSVDWVELNPALDPSGRSVETAVALLATLLGESMR